MIDFFWYCFCSCNCRNEKISVTSCWCAKQQQKQFECEVFSFSSLFNSDTTWCEYSYVKWNLEMELVTMYTIYIYISLVSWKLPVHVVQVRGNIFSQINRTVFVFLLLCIHHIHCFFLQSRKKKMRKENTFNCYACIQTINFLT